MGVVRVLWRQFLWCSAADLRHSLPMSTSTLEEYFSPPEAVRGIKVLDRAVFQRDFELPAIRLSRANLCSSFLKRLTGVTLRFPSIKGILNEPSEDGKEPVKVLLLTPPHLLEKPLSPEDHKWIADHGGEEVSRVVSLGYEHYSKRTILQAILPPELEQVPTGFEQVGHIAHYNLDEEFLPYRNLIGQLTLDKNPSLRTVVNKTAEIDTTFRFFKMEVLAGEEDFVATVRENGCTFTFDFSAVYWNSRLITEHSRIVESLKKEDVVLDVFAGVGPFAVAAAKNKGCTVHANDLNPHSFKYLKENAKTNHVSGRVMTYNLDGRDFLTDITKSLVGGAFPSGVKNGSSPVCPYSTVIMNLPASAVEFLDAFRGLFCCVSEEFRSLVILPLIHCYCFVKSGSYIKTGSEQEYTGAALLQVCRHLGVSLLDGQEDCHVKVVRDVSPRKAMVRVSFRLPPEVAYCSGEEAKQGTGKREEGVMDTVQEEGCTHGGQPIRNTEFEPPTKRSKLDDNS